MQACKEFLDRVEGKVTEKIDFGSAVKPPDLIVNVIGVKAKDGRPAKEPEEIEHQKNNQDQKLLEDK